MIENNKQNNKKSKQIQEANKICTCSESGNDVKRLTKQLCLVALDFWCSS